MTNRADQIYVAIVGIFSALLILTNVVGIKYIQAPFAPSLALTASIIVYPVTFMLTDLVTEIWDARRAQFMVFVGFFASLLVVVVIEAALLLPAHPYWVAPNNPFG